LIFERSVSNDSFAMKVSLQYFCAGRPAMPEAGEPSAAKHSAAFVSVPWKRRSRVSAL
jgi:hypothetical protein